MNDPTREWRLNALTNLETGSVKLQHADKQLQEHMIPDRLVTTGLLGSIRWWFEVLARSLGGAACDPSDDANRWPDQQGKRCVACELLGCAGWGRTFRADRVLAHVQSSANATVVGQLEALGGWGRAKGSGLEQLAPVPLWAPGSRALNGKVLWYVQESGLWQDENGRA